MTIYFDRKGYRDLVCRFGEQVPELLSKHSITSDLARQVDMMDIVSVLDSRFTVAIIGQMRAGKSTLLNAIIRKDLAPTGINETTATINWFRYGEGDIEDKFRVHWKDGSQDDYPLEEVNEWLGKSEHAEKTVALDFFSKNGFLKHANLVDTPGTRSVLDSHEGATKDFLFDEKASERAEKDSLEQGSKADAVIYVLNPVTRQRDSDLLSMFGEETRLPGANAYNSIAVVQKWELGSLNESMNPLDYVAKKCVRIQEQLKGKVARVLPVSGIIARKVQVLPDVFWKDVARIALETSKDNLDWLLESDDELGFLNPDIPCPISAAQRKKMVQAFGITSILRVCIRLAYEFKIREGKRLRTQLWKASNIEKLQKLLVTQFFKQAGLIKANTVLRKAWLPCTIGIARLRDAEEESRENHKRGLESLEALQQMQSAQSSKIEQYIRHSLKAVQDNMHNIRELRTKLERLRSVVFDNFSALEKDLDCIEALNGEECEELNDDQKSELSSLFGLSGTEIWLRLGYPGETKIDDMTERAEDLLDYWEEQNYRGNPHKRVAEHACLRLNQILDSLEEGE